MRGMKDRKGEKKQKHGKERQDEHKYSLLGGFKVEDACLVFARRISRLKLTRQLPNL